MATGAALREPGAAFRRDRSGFEALLDLKAPGEGGFNMRRDAELLDGAARGAPPTLRLYRWARPTLSIGHSQILEIAADPEALARRGVSWVRRPTGGRALLHLPDELTYAFAADRRAAPGIRAAYRRIMKAIREALGVFTVLDPSANHRPGRDTPPRRLPCLAAPSGHEITVGGRKFVAGAQRWRRGAFLQHGSIPWTVDRALTNELTGFPPESPIRAAALSELTAGRGGPPRIEAVAEALFDSFAREFGGFPVVG